MNKEIFLMSQRKLLKKLKHDLKEKYGYKKILSNHLNEYIIAEGDIPIALMAHADTVAEGYTNTLPQQILYDKEQDILSASAPVLDDRLGIAAIINILECGFRPHIIITTDEELGCLGAEAIIINYPKCPLKDLKFIIELDRCGQNDACFYSCNNRAFKSFISSFGFKEAKGTFSDCITIGKGWDIAAVNVSIGYMLEHTVYEYGRVDWMDDTISKVKRILYSNEYTRILYSNKYAHTYKYNA